VDSHLSFAEMSWSAAEVALFSRWRDFTNGSRHGSDFNAKKFATALPIDVFA
jgi:hypothetical protein